MKTIGLIGGMSWESTAIYYSKINRMVRARLGGNSSGKILLHSLNFAEIEALQLASEWTRCGEILTESASILKQGGADCILICANTMHKVAESVQESIAVPLIHIGRATGLAIRSSGLKKVGLLATQYTMEEPFLKQIITESSGAVILVPPAEDRPEIHRIIYQELTQGTFSTESKMKYLSAIDDLRERGAQGIIFGCTEIGLLLERRDLKMPFFDTADLHAQAAVDFALERK